MDGKISKFPIGIQNFTEIIEGNYLYIDKTEYIYKLVHNGKSYFLSRPRRFGKSLFLSTLRAYWEGKRELFKCLKIEALEAENENAWEPYPVFYFDFNRDNFNADFAIENVLDAHLTVWEQKYNCINSAPSLAIRFQNVLRHANEREHKQCVILVDEYDKALLETVEDNAKLGHSKAVFKGFFSTLKSFDSYIKFVFITGVTKFSKVSIFSDLNQLEDISFDDEYSGICGITEEEIRNVLTSNVEKMAAERKISTDECFERLKIWYDGYCFSPEGVGVYNPFSLLSALKKCRFNAYWYETGTPTFLVKKLRKLNFDIRQIDEEIIEASQELLSDYRIENPDPVPLLYQTGYLTIKGYTEYIDESLYTLGFPNSEVRYAFLQSLMPEYVGNCGSGSGKDIYSLKRYIDNGDVEGVHNLFTALFASIPYTTNDAPFEHYFQTVIFIVFTLLGKFAQCEMHTANGRIDCGVETKDFVYIFEFKRDKSAEEALQQIEDSNYAEPYAADSRKLFLIGANFSSETRELEGWIVKEKNAGR